MRFLEEGFEERKGECIRTCSEAPWIFLDTQEWTFIFVFKNSEKYNQLIKMGGFIEFFLYCFGLVFDKNGL